MRINFNDVSFDLFSEDVGRIQRGLREMEVWISKAPPLLKRVLSTTSSLVSTNLQFQFYVNNTSTLFEMDIKALQGTSLLRFVRDLLDRNKGRRDCSMATLAKDFGVPTSIVTSRNKFCHEEEESIRSLNKMVGRCLTHLQDVFWNAELTFEDENEYHRHNLRRDVNQTPNAPAASTSNSSRGRKRGNNAPPSGAPVPKKKKQFSRKKKGINYTRRF